MRRQISWLGGRSAQVVIPDVRINRSSSRRICYGVALAFPMETHNGMLACLEIHVGINAKG